MSDTLRQDAVTRRIQIIGEAVRHLSHELLAGMPDFPAKQARGMRNVLVHDYDAVNLERLWDERMANRGDEVLKNSSTQEEAVS